MACINARVIFGILEKLNAQLFDVMAQYIVS